MHLYALQVTRLEYDTISWFETEHHVEEVLNENQAILENEAFNPFDGGHYIFLQTEGDYGADVGDKFSVPEEELGRLSNTFALRGVRYNQIDYEGNITTRNIGLVLKSPGDIRFTP